ncbi:MAG: hypothetical protein OD918_11535 [Gammaproteobacteria bacterium]
MAYKFAEQIGTIRSFQPNARDHFKGGWAGPRTNQYDIHMVIDGSDDWWESKYYWESDQIGITINNETLSILPWFDPKSRSWATNKTAWLVLERCLDNTPQETLAVGLQVQALKHFILANSRTISTFALHETVTELVNNLQSDLQQQINALSDRISNLPPSRTYYITSPSAPSRRNGGEGGGR